jgi:hypothetical protein
MPGAVEDGAGQGVEAGIDQDVGPVALTLPGPHFCDQKSGLGGQVTARLDFETDPVPERILEPSPRGVPEVEVSGKIGMALL